jgi:hypothetical protein
MPLGAESTTGPSIRIYGMLYSSNLWSFHFVALTSSTYLFTAGVEFVYFHLIALTHNTFGRTSLDEGSTRRRDLYLTTQTLYKTNIHAPGGIRTHDPSKRSAADLSVRPRSQWDRPLLDFDIKYVVCYMLSCFFGFSTYLTGKLGVTHAVGIIYRKLVSYPWSLWCDC